MAKLLFDNFHKLYKLQTTIVSDRDKVFTISFLENLFRLVGNKLYLSSIYYLQTNWQSEMLNQHLKNYLRCMTGATQK